MDSRKGLFKVKFLSRGGELKILPSIDKAFDGIVIARAGLSFTINVLSKFENISYASKLFIDSQEVISCKTFKKRGNFFGFRKGGGSYDQFVFKIPEFLNDMSSKGDQDSKERAKKMGDIRIVFFEATESLKRVNPDILNKPRKQNEPSFVPVPQADVKQGQARSLSVAFGNGFTISVPGNFNIEQNGRQMIKSTKPDFESPVDQIVFRYSNPPTLIACGLLSPFSKNHWKYFPVDFLMDNELILSVIIQGILSSNKNMPVSEVTTIMQNALECNPDELWSAGFNIIYQKAKFKTAITKEDVMKAANQRELNKFCAEIPSRKEIEDAYNNDSEKRKTTRIESEVDEEPKKPSEPQAFKKDNKPPQEENKHRSTKSLDPQKKTFQSKPDMRMEHSSKPDHHNHHHHNRDNHNHDESSDQNVKKYLGKRDAPAKERRGGPVHYKK